jgi:adenylate cyclase class IV
MHNYEIEIKVLLWDEEKKNIFMKKVQDIFPELEHKYSESQRNHYFEWGNLLHLLGTFREYISQEEAASLHKLIQEAKSFSVRTRGTIDETILVVKATVNDESSSNGTARIEWEADLAPMSLDDMDTKVLAAGFSYQAKWSRARDEYKLNHDTALCIDKNAGYGYLAEFERVIDDPSLVDATRAELLSMIESLGYAELDQDRLARMFDFYNKNWSEYYGTEKVFTVL